MRIFVCLAGNYVISSSLPLNPPQYYMVKSLENILKIKEVKVVWFSMLKMIVLFMWFAHRKQIN